MDLSTTRRLRTWAAICALTFACDKRALTYLLEGDRA